MPVFLKGERSVLFIHIPKSAGSSIEQVGYCNGWNETFSMRGRELKDLGFFKSTPQHLHLSVLREIFDLDAFDNVFTVVRNPFSRIKSEYYWQRAQGLTGVAPDYWLQDTFSRYMENNYLYDNHIRPQVEFLPDTNNSDIFKLEEAGVKSAGDIFNSYGHGVESSFRRVWGHFFAHRVSKKSTLDPSIESAFKRQEELIYKFYEEDFKVLNYEI